MTVKELIKRLKTCNQNAEVCIEAWSDPEVEIIQEYYNKDCGERVVYIGDDLDDLTFQLKEEGYVEVN